MALKKRGDKVVRPETGADNANATSQTDVKDRPSSNDAAKVGSKLRPGRGSLKGQPIFNDNTVTDSISTKPPYQGRLGQLLLEKKLVTQDQLDRALLEQSQSGGKLGEVLVAMGVLDNQALASELATFFGLTVVNLRRDNVDPAVIALVPEELAREQMLIPVRLEDNSLYVAVAKPTDQMRDYLQELTGHKVILMIAPPSDITWAIDSNYRHK